jgi:glycosyltransferase involved in cell wall biosynthesis
VRRLRLLFVNQYAWPDEAATAQLMTDVAEEAAARGIPCQVVASDRSYSDPSVRYPRHETKGTTSYERVPATAFGRESAIGRVTDYMTFLVGAAWRLLRGGRPDVVVGMSTPPILGALAVAAARIRGARSAYWAMDVYPDLAFELGSMKSNSVLGRAFAALSHWTLRRADLVIALGETMAGRLSMAGARNVAVVHNWADGDAIRPMRAEDSRISAERGWRQKFVVLYSGNLGLAHEFDTLLGAAEALRGEGVVFAFCGAGPRRAEVEAEAKRRSLTNVEFHPSVCREELGDLLAAGHLHAVTMRPRMAGLLVPSKVYGILAAGRPILYVGPAEGEIHDIISREDVGSSVRGGDVIRLVAEIRRFRDESAERARAGKRARDLFNAKFTRSGQTGKLVGLLANLARDA